MARRECVRCGVIVHDLAGADNEHICKDVLARLRRREKQRDAAIGVFEEFGLLDGLEETKTRICERIVEVLANLGVDRD